MWYDIEFDDGVFILLIFTKEYFICIMGQGILFGEIWES
jgi:hypothetical protein